MISRIVSARLPVETYARLLKYAKEKQITVSEALERLVDDATATEDDPWEWLLSLSKIDAPILRQGSVDEILYGPDGEASR